MSAGSSGTLDRLCPLLVSNLNVANIIPYLRQEQLLTNDEAELLQQTARTRQEAAIKLIAILKTKGSDSVRRFLLALKQSMDEDCHLGHGEIISKLDESLKECKFKEANKTGSCKEEERNVQDLRCKVMEDSQEIKALFATLVLNVYRLLQGRKAPVKDITVALAFLEGNEEKMSASSSGGCSEDLAELFKNLHKFSSWFNYFAIKFLATTFGGDQGKVLMDTYEEQLKIKLIDRLVSQCPEFALTRELPHHYQELTIKLEYEYMLYTVEQLSFLRNTMARLLNLKPSTFILQSVEEGCVLLTWAVPTSSCSAICPQVTQHVTELEKLMVISIKSGSTETLFKKGDDHFVEPYMAKNECSSAVSHMPASSNTLNVLKRLSNNAVELELLSVYSGVLPVRHYSLNESSAANKANDIPKSASFCGISEPKSEKKHFKLLRRWFGHITHLSRRKQKEGQTDDKTLQPEAAEEVDPIESPLLSPIAPTPTFSELAYTSNVFSSDRLAPSLHNCQSNLASASSSKFAFTEDACLTTATGNSVESIDYYEAGSLTSLHTCASKRTNVTSGYNSLERSTVYGLGSTPRRSNSVSEARIRK